MHKNYTIGVVILNYNDASTTDNLSNQIKNYSIIDKIVIVDNCSPDDSFGILQKLKSNKIDVIRSDKNGGYSYGNNYGAFYLIEKYDIDILFIANPDVSFDEKFVEVISDNLINNKAQIITGVMLDGEGKIRKYGGKNWSYFQDLINCTILLKKGRDILFPKRTNYIKEINFIEIVPGCLFGIKAETFKEINGFDDNVFLFCEERILNAKFKKIGYKIAINSTVSFKHLHSVSINKSINKYNKLKQEYESLFYYYQTYGNIGRIKLEILKLFLKYGLFARKILYKILY